MSTRTLYHFIICLFIAAAGWTSELPLFLERTIQLPGGTAYWDVLPRSHGSFDWIAAYAESDTNTVIEWGNTLLRTGGTITLESVGRPNSLDGFFYEGEPSVVVGTNRRYGPIQWWTDTTTVQIFRLSSGFSLASPHKWAGSGGNEVYSSFINGNTRLVHCAMIPAAPESTERITAVLSTAHEHNGRDDGSYWGDGMVIHDLLSSDPVRFDSARYLNASASCWDNERSLLVTHGSREHWAGISPEFTYVLDIAVWDITNQVSHLHQFPQLHGSANSHPLYVDPEPRVHAIILTEERIPIVVMTVSADTLAGFNAVTGARLWEQYLENCYWLTALTTRTFPSLFTEQVLLFDWYDQNFKILLSDGTLAGVSDSIARHPDEMKIIGRYSNEYLRLAIRYDDEIRIYSFGELAPPPIPSAYDLGVFPNPFNQSTTIRFILTGGARAQLALFNTLGQKVATVADDYFFAGSHSVHFSDNRLTSGVYFLRLNAGVTNTTKKMVLLR